ncbi:hypothetical protein TanjilG_00611 [Lupinus angustifolius]|uniref:Uncharacterized protein n=1 Tax=Lupinus angustifolius TaxID=3871 RepID=A0A394D9Y6_LUPAN|nr:hypothetical protein TanjilG_00611 [Lupinus angustifolius]
MADVYFSFFTLLIIIPLSLLAFLYFIVRPRTVRIPIKNRNVFITGGSSGIGLALAHRATVEGARVSILSLSRNMLEEARNTVKLATGSSKFGLRGLAEALQHEVIADNIHVSLIFLPDTDTPGTVEGIELNA